MERIAQSTAKRVLLKAFLASDHISPATGKTIAVVISKNGAAFGNPNAGATNATAIGNGWYYVDLDATDTGTLGPLVVRGTEGTIDDTEIAFSVEASVQTEVWAKTLTQPSGVFGWTDTIWDLVRWVGVRNSNKETFDGSTLTQRNRADSSTLATAMVTDSAGTTTRGSFS